MIKGVNRPAIFYDLVGLAHSGVVSVGRESDSTIRLDCPEVPFLLSRKHAKICVNPDGSLILKDINSTNGTYIAREGEFLRRLRSDEGWELRRGDLVRVIAGCMGFWGTNGGGGIAACLLGSHSAGWAIAGLRIRDAEAASCHRLTAGHRTRAQHPAPCLPWSPCCLADCLQPWALVLSMHADWLWRAGDHCCA